jgi:hypothetical protein
MYEAREPRFVVIQKSLLLFEIKFVKLSDYNSRVDSNKFTMGNPGGVDLNPMSESTLSPSQGLWIWPQLARKG